MPAEQLKENASVAQCPFTGKSGASEAPANDPRLSEPQCPFSAASPGAVKVGKTDAPRVPKIKTTPFIGPFKEFTGDVMPFLNEQRKIYGDAFRFPIFGLEQTILAGDDAIALLEHDELLTTKDKMDTLVQAVGSRLPGTFDGPYHKHYKRMQTAWLNRKLERERRPEVAEAVVDNVAHWKVGYEFNPLHETQAQTVDILSRVLNGEKFPFNHKELALVIRTLIFATYGPAPLWLTLNVPGFKKTMAKFNENSLKLCRRVKSDPEFADKTLMGQYLKYEAKEDIGGEWKDEDLKVVPMAAYLAGYDTVASAAAFMSYQLLANPEWLEKVREEYVTLSRENDGDVDPMKQKVLRACFMETTRIHPPGILVIRTATKDFQFKGYQIRKGDNVIIQIASNNMDEDIYGSNVEQFDPSRFLGDELTSRKRALLTFGSGAHRCSGAMIGPLFSQEMVAHWVNYFDLELVEGHDKPVVKCLPFTQPFNLKLRVKARRDPFAQ